jgi:hypothetical protein
MSIFKDIHDEIIAAAIEPSGRDLNILALVFLVVPSAIGGLWLWRGFASGWWLIGIGAGLAVLRVIPPLFRRVYRLWLAFSIVLGFFVSRILLTLIFFLLITPVGLIMRATGKDPMERKIDPEANSYWIPRSEQNELTVERYERQF